MLLKLQKVLNTTQIEVQKHPNDMKFTDFKGIRDHFVPHKVRTALYMWKAYKRQSYYTKEFFTIDR